MNACNEVNTNRSVLAGDEEPEETALPLPTGLEPLPNQVAGHKYGVKGSKNYLLKERNTGFVLKQIGDKRGLIESQFYENLFANNCCPKLMKLRQFVPLYRGRVTMNGSQFNALDDICASFRCPCVMDVKIGAITYDHEASAEKIAKESSKYPPAREIGFRILGIRVFKEKCNDYLVLNGDYGKQLTTETIVDGLKMYVNFDDNDNERRMQLVQQILDRLNAIQDWFVNDNVNFLKFISSSLLFVYSSVEKQIRCDVRMIDFAHVFPNHNEANGHLEATNTNANLDDNYLFGLRKIIECFEKVKESFV